MLRCGIGGIDISYAAPDSLAIGYIRMASCQMRIALYMISDTGVSMQFLVEFLKNLLKQSSVRVVIVSTVVNAMLYGWSALAQLPGFPAWIPDPSPVFFEIGKWVELILAGWASSTSYRLYNHLRLMGGSRFDYK